MAREPKTRSEWDAAWERKHRDAKGRTADGRRSMLWLEDATGQTVLLIEPEWATPRPKVKRSRAERARILRQIGTAKYDRDVTL